MIQIIRQVSHIVFTRKRNCQEFLNHPVRGRKGTLHRKMGNRTTRGGGLSGLPCKKIKLWGEINPEVRNRLLVTGGFFLGVFSFFRRSHRRTIGRSAVGVVILAVKLCTKKLGEGGM